MGDSGASFDLPPTPPPPPPSAPPVTRTDPTVQQAADEQRRRLARQYGREDTFLVQLPSEDTYKPLVGV